MGEQQTDEFLATLEKIEASHSEPKPRGRGATKALKLADLKKSIATLVDAANQGLVSFVPQYAWSALNPDEAKALSEALAGEVQASARLTEMLGKASKVTPHMELVKVASMLFLTRWITYQQIKAGTAQQQPRDIVPPTDFTPRPVYNGIQDATEAQEPVSLWQN